MYELALLGLGVIRLSDIIVGPAIRSGRLVPILLDVHQPEPLPLHAVYTPDPTPAAEGGRGDPVPRGEVRYGALATAAPVRESAGSRRQTPARARQVTDARPLRPAKEAEIRARFQAALAAGDGAAGAHCIHEWWMRNAFPSHIEAALALLWKHAAPSIPEWLPMHYVSWLPAVYDVAVRFRAAKRGRQNIYLVRLDYSDRGAGEQGIYVGMTAYPPAQRFDQHRAGIRAAGSVAEARAGAADRPGAAPAAHRASGCGAHRAGPGGGVGRRGAHRRGRALKHVQLDSSCVAVNSA